ncbi:hypothetical protein NC652_015152 [Populus alba x Populus x berolinensis]|nr:hypothetical protein NC652_015152 [Populus alba x Populus x berolinensis]
MKNFFSNEASFRKSLLFAAGILAAGGTAVYVQSRIRSKKSDSFFIRMGSKMIKRYQISWLLMARKLYKRKED